MAPKINNYLNFYPEIRGNKSNSHFNAQAQVNFTIRTQGDIIVIAQPYQR